MSAPNYVLLYVQNPPESAKFYSDLLGIEPVENSPTFALFPLPSGVMLGMWTKENVVPPTTQTGGGTELAFRLESDTAVAETYEAWTEKGLPILQFPTEMDFGYTFTAADPDGHRLRVFARNEA